MYVRKFEADSMDEALKAVKAELGPDAIILKTITNNGLKSAFKKNKVEVTAAISEKNYTKKAKVDAVLDSPQKQDFYNSSSGYISNMIDNFNEKESKDKSRFDVKSAGYGGMGMNKPVQTQNDNPTRNLSELDSFLGGNEAEEEEVFVKRELPVEREERFQAERPQYVEEEPIVETREVPSQLNSVVESQKERIDLLESKLMDLISDYKNIQKSEPAGLLSLRETLGSFDINSCFIRDLIKKCTFELGQEDLGNQDITFEFALSEMLSLLNVSMPLFSTMDGTAPCVTVFISDTSCGQSNMVKKIGAMKEDCQIISNNDSSYKVMTKLTNSDVNMASTISDLVSSTRAAVENGKSVFIDYKANLSEIEDSKKFIDGLRRAFGNVEVLICLSAITSELYNKNVINRYGQLADGLVMTHLDICLNYGSIFNLGYEYQNLPFKFFGTGRKIPEDIETATGERILAGIFKF